MFRLRPYFDQLKEVYQEYVKYMEQEFQHQGNMLSDQCLLARALEDKIEQMQSLMGHNKDTRI